MLCTENVFNLKSKTVLSKKTKSWVFYSRVNISKFNYLPYLISARCKKLIEKSMPAKPLNYTIYRPQR